MENLKLKQKIETLFDSHIDTFIVSLKDEEFGDIDNIEKFYTSKIFEDFNDIALAHIVGALKDMKITSEDFEEFVKDYRIKFTDAQINKLIAITDPPIPPGIPPTGKKYIKERKKDGTAEWVLVDEA